MVDTHFRRIILDGRLPAEEVLPGRDESMRNRKLISTSLQQIAGQEGAVAVPYRRYQTAKQKGA